MAEETITLRYQADVDQLTVKIIELYNALEKVKSAMDSINGTNVNISITSDPDPCPTATPALK